MHRAVELGAVLGEIREQVHVRIKRHHQSFVALAQDALQEGATGLLNGAEHELLAAGGVQQKRQGDGKRNFFREKGDLLILIVFRNLEIFLLQIAHDALVLVANSHEEVDQVDLRLDYLSRCGAFQGQRRQGQRPDNQCRSALRHNLLYGTHVYFPRREMPGRKTPAGYRRPVGCREAVRWMRG